MQPYKIISAASLFFALGTAQAQVAVVVSSSSSVDKLSREQIAAIFMGRSHQLPGGLRAIPVDNATDAVREQFANKVLGKSPSQVKSAWSRLIFSGTASPPKEAADSAAVKAFVNANPGSIGYIETSAVDSTVKVMLSE